MLGLYSVLVCCEILLLLDMADMDCLFVEDCGESNAECCVLLVGVDRVMFLWCA